MIVPMKKMTLIALRDDEERVMLALQKSGTCEIIPPDDGAGDLNAELFSSFDAQLRELDAAADILKPYAKKTGLLTPLPEVDENKLSDTMARRSAMELAREISGLAESVREKNAEAAKVMQMQNLLMPLTTFDIPLESLKGTKHTMIKCGYLSKAAAHILSDEGIASETSDSDKNTMFCVLYLHKSDADEKLHILTEAGFTQYSVPALTGTARENYDELQRNLCEVKAETDKLIGRIRELAGRRDELLLSEDAVNVEYDRLRAMSELLKSQSAFIMRAWLCAKDAEDVEKLIKNSTDGAYYIDFADPSEDEEPPSVVYSPQPFTAFESITNMYSRPSYRGIDASPQITPFYMLFFGMMLGDVGYGLLLFIGTMLFSKLKKPSGGMKKLIDMFKWSGLATMVCGVLFGSFFGMDIDMIFGTKDVFPLIMDPMSQVMGMLILCCGLGIVHMLYGLCLKIYMCMREGDTASAIFDNLSWIFLIVGGIGAVAVPKPFGTAFLITAAIGVGLILIFGGRNKKGIMRIFGGLGSLYNITSWLSDTVSYARVFAIGLVGGAMGQVFNMIGAMIGGAGSGFAHVIFLIFAAVVLIALHLFSLFINTLSAFAHTSRLQYVEFFGKFYEAGGREFTPLAVNTKNVRIVSDRSK